MNEDSQFPFVFLQSAGDVCKTLVIPASYQWNAQLSLVVRKTIYIFLLLQTCQM